MTVPLTMVSDVDILFVIDNSGSMANPQMQLSANFAAFLNVLEAPEAGLNYRIGITTTDAGGNPQCPAAVYRPAGGKLVLSSCLDRIDDGDFVFRNIDFSYACTEFCNKSGGVIGSQISVASTTTDKDGTPRPRHWIEYADGQSNIQGVSSNTEAFQCFGPQGVSGCGFEAHLESMYKALELSNQQISVTNYDFVRAEANLAVVFVSDETDCSWKDSKKEIFTPANKVFWADPDGFQPSSALCINAGVQCFGGPGTYTDCQAANYDLAGQVGATDEDAVLEPLSKYVGFVQNLVEQKQAINGASVLVSLLAGVPVGYESFATEIPYADAEDELIQEDFGIGPGCIVPNPDDPTDPDIAIPPVREREFAEAFVDDPSTERNLYSICEASYTTALQTIATKIRDRTRPPCVPLCVRDINPETPTVVPACTVRQQNLGMGTKSDLPECIDQGGTWTLPMGAPSCWAPLVDKSSQTPGTYDDMSSQCANTGFNLEVRLIHGAPPPAGTTYSATCEVSANAAVDCPDL